MRIILFSAFLFFLSGKLSSQSWSLDDVEIFHSFEDFEHVLNEKNDTTYVINFWATWCAPCVKELPYFEELNSIYESEPLKVVLVSLDFEKQIESRLIPFLNKKKIQSDVVLLLDGKESAWIDKVDPRWSGAIPITIIYKYDRRIFKEKSFHSTEELIKLIEEL
jgi:thiol-disulfide isomerase/thioredoxin